MVAPGLVYVLLMACGGGEGEKNRLHMPMDLDKIFMCALVLRLMFGRRCISKQSTSKY